MNETLLSIVSISNSGEGKEQVYQGLYVGRQLIVPIGCEDIKFMEYEERRYEYPHDKIRKKGIISATPETGSRDWFITME